MVCPTSRTSVQWCPTAPTAAGSGSAPAASDPSNAVCAELCSLRTSCGSAGCRNQERADDGGGQHEHDDAERNGRRDGREAVHVVGGGLHQHLDPDESEDHRQTLVEQVEAGQEAGEAEVQRPQAQDRQGVGRVDDEQVVADGQHGGNAVDGKQDVGSLDGDHDGEQAG